MIVATAGHVDHGKTVLVKALTGVDTDRLPEEKKRGLSIDLGFAYAPLAGNDVLGFVDVPGHERFVANMLSGVSAIDYALLIVAADDGPMPQTLEHLAILDLLNIEQGAIVITKIDRVEASRVTEVQAEVRELTQGTVLENAEIFLVAALEGTGISALKERLETVAQGHQSRRVHGNFRLAVDRAFSVPGAGLVVTGAIFSGSVQVGDRLLLSPNATEVRVRGIHAQNRQSTTGRAGQRCALNLAGAALKLEDVHRGDWVLDPFLHHPSNRMDVEIRVLRTEKKNLRHWTPVHVHLGAAHVTGRVALLEQRALAPGESALAQLVLDAPLFGTRADRLVIRDQSAQRTIAGGILIDPYSPARGRARAPRLRVLRALAQPNADAALAASLDLAEGGLPLSSFAQTWNLTPDDAEQLWQTVPMIRIGKGADSYGLSKAHWQALNGEILDAVKAWHVRHPETLGPGELEIRRAIPRLAALQVLGPAIQALLDSGRLARQGTIYHLPDHAAQPTSQENALWRKIEPILEDGGIKPPVEHDIGAELGLARRPLTNFFNRAAQLGLVYRVTPNRYYLPEAIAELGKIAEQLAHNKSDGLFTVAEYRDRTGIGRNLAIEVLEYFDKVGITRRQGNFRRIVRASEDVFG